MWVGMNGAVRQLAECSCRQAEALPVQRMLEEDLYFCLLHFLFKSDCTYVHKLVRSVAPEATSEMRDQAWQGASAAVESYLYGQVRRTQSTTGCLVACDTSA